MPTKLDSPQAPEIILLTGGLAAGKTTVATLLVELSPPKSVALIDTDVLARSLLEPGTPCFNQVVSHFGKSILTETRESETLSLPQINRQKLREIIFNSREEKLWLEKLLHPKIRELALAQVDHLKDNHLKTSSSVLQKIIIIIPLLASLSAKESYPADKIITVESPLSLQIERVIKRDHISEELATKIIESQPSSEQRLKIADVVIWNMGDKALLKETLLKLIA